MLGKTNITTLSEGAVVTEVEDFKWIQMQSGVRGNFVKAVYKNDCLAAITADGTVAYTADGEVWQASVLAYEDCRLNDIYWDGSRFILAGSYKAAAAEDTNILLQTGLILTTVDFASYSQVEIPGQNSFYSSGTDIVGTWASEYLGIYMENGKYFVLAVMKYDSIYTASNSFNYERIYRYIGDLAHKWESEVFIDFKNLNPLHSAANNSSKFIVSCSGSFKNGANVSQKDNVCIITSNEIKIIDGYGGADNLLTPVFECKNELYYMRLYGKYNYVLAKVAGNDEKVMLSTDISYGFVDGVYFNESLIFINAHEMLVIKKGESIADKTLDDLIEIAPELTMNCITKAFGQLYIFGNQGAILKSSVETNNENAIAVQSMSAKRALAEANQYTDGQYAALESRIAALEEKFF